MEQKKDAEKIRLNQEKDDELKWIQENELILKRQEKLRLQKLYSTESNNIVQNHNLNKKSDNIYNKVVNSNNSKQVYINEEIMLNELRAENM